MAFGLKSLGGVFSDPKKMQLLGATLRDVGTGGRSNFIGNQVAANEEMAAAERLAMLQNQVAGLFGPGAVPDPGQPPRPVAPQGLRAENHFTSPEVARATAPPGFDLANDQPFANAPPPRPAFPTLREAAPILAQAGIGGMDVSDIVSILDKTAPNIQVSNGVGYDTRDGSNIGQRIGTDLANVNGFMVDTQDPQNAGRYMPDLQPGEEPLYDRQGNVVAVQNLQGAVQALSEREAATAGARAQYDPFTYTDAQGRTVTAPRTALAGGQGGQGQYGGAAPGGSPQGFVGRSPEEEARAVAMAEAQAQAAIDLPLVTEKAEYAMGLIDQIIGNEQAGIPQHPAYGQRIGAGSYLPAIRGTPGFDLDTMVAQLQGKAFLEAFETLKGGGQITEIEGQKATDAIARLKQGQSGPGFQAALTELREILGRGMERARTRAGGQNGAGGASGAAPTYEDLVAERQRRGR